MAVQDIGITGAIDIDPAGQTEAVFSTVILRSKVIHKCLHMLFHQRAELDYNRVLQLKEIVRIVPAPGIRTARVVALVAHQSKSQIFDFFVQVGWAVLAVIDPGREETYQTDFYVG